MNCRLAEPPPACPLLSVKQCRAVSWPGPAYVRLSKLVYPANPSWAFLYKTIPTLRRKKSINVERAHSFSSLAPFRHILFVSAGRSFHSISLPNTVRHRQLSILFNMRFSTITLLALGATASAYVVPNRQVVDNAVKARMPVCGSDPLCTATLTNNSTGK